MRVRERGRVQTVGSFRPFLQERERDTHTQRERGREGGREGNQTGRIGTAVGKVLELIGRLAVTGAWRGGGRGELRWLGWTPESTRYQDG